MYALYDGRLSLQQCVNVQNLINARNLIILVSINLDELKRI
jgi:hypothetical protein